MPRRRLLLTGLIVEELPCDDGRKSRVRPREREGGPAHESDRSYRDVIESGREKERARERERESKATGWNTHTDVGCMPGFSMETPPPRHAFHVPTPPPRNHSPCPCSRTLTRALDATRHTLNHRLTVARRKRALPSHRHARPLAVWVPERSRQTCLFVFQVARCG